jgi:hypothetical protein
MPRSLSHLGISIFFAALASASVVQPAEPPALSPGWSRALPPGPDTRVKITEAYAKLIGKETYFWVWPMANIYNRRLTFKDVPEPMMNGPVPIAPLNTVAMLTDYITPDERAVACPNQDVVYGAGSLALDVEPAVVQVPDFGDRFWVYQMVDLRTDSFVQLGKMYATTPGFYLLVGPNWKGEVPKGITKVFRSPTNTGFMAPRVFQDDTPEDKKAIQSVIQQVMIYPLSKYDGTMKRTDWTKLKVLPAQKDGETESRFVFPEKILDQLTAILADAPPFPGEEARYAQVLAVVEAAKSDPKLGAALEAGAKEAEDTLVTPLFQFRNYGQQLQHNWSTISNEAAFGTDYFTRTAVAKSNILVNSPNETKYFYQDLDAAGERLNGKNNYTVTFAKGATPPVNGFWSMTLYNEHHFFSPNDLDRYSLGTKNKGLKHNADGSLTLYVQASSPGSDNEANWLPSPREDFSLYIRAYWPKAEVMEGSWLPPAVTKHD